MENYINAELEMFLDEFTHPKRQEYIKRHHATLKKHKRELIEVYGEERARYIVSGYYEDHYYNLNLWGTKCQNCFTMVGLHYHLQVHFTEAKKIIDVLIQDQQYSKEFEFEVNRLFYDRKNKHYDHKIITVNMNRVQMIERLEWISGQNFGDDIQQWHEWSVVFETQGIRLPRWIS